MPGAKYFGPLALTCLVLLALGGTARAQFSTTSDNNGGLTITAYTGPSGPVVIPSTINGLPVTGIAIYAFSYTSPTSVTIPSSVTSIEEYAFESCNLTSVNIPDSVTSLGDDAFAYCSHLASVTMGAGVTSIGVRAFYECLSLTSLAIGPNVTTIGDSAFDGCTTLTSLTIPSKVTTLGPSAFAGCYALTTVAIPDNVTTIGQQAFWDCLTLTSVTIGSGVTSIANMAFDNCPLLTTITVSAANTAFSNNADGVLFDKAQHTLVQFPCGKYGPYIIPNGVTTIGAAAFAYAANLQGITLPNGLVTISDNAFQYSGRLQPVVIPNSVTTIGNAAFAGTILNGLTMGTAVVTIGQGAFLSSSTADITLPNTLTTIGDSAFGSCLMDTITIPDSVTSLGPYAFASCANLRNVTIGAGVTTIQSDTFDNCTNLNTVSWGPNVTTIQDFAFANCDALQSVKFSSNITSLGFNSFSGCSSLAIAYFDGNAPTLGGNVFSSAAHNFRVAYANNATGFTTPTWAVSGGDTYPAVPYYATTVSNGQVTITGYNGPGGDVVIGPIGGLPVTAIEQVFFGSSTITSVSLPASVTNIQLATFGFGYVMTSITVNPANPVFSSNDGVLYNKNQTTLIQFPSGRAGSFTIPSGVTTLATESFEGARLLTSLTIPATVTDIQYGAVADCTQLINAIFLGNAPTTDVSIFQGESSGFSVLYCQGAAGFTFPTWTDSSNQTFPSSVIPATAPHTFSTWQSQLGATGTPVATPLNDSVPNLLKYLYDIDPNAPMTMTDQAALPTGGMDTTSHPGVTYLTLTYRKNAAATDITPTVEVSSDLQTWQPLTSAQYLTVPGGSEVGASGVADSMMTVKVDVTGAASKYIRLQVPSP